MPNNKIESELILPTTKPSAGYTNAAVVDIEEPESLPLPKSNGNYYKTKNASDTVAIARAAFKTGRTKKLEFRREQLKNLLRLFDENAKTLEEALKQDLGRPRQEASSFDVDFSRSEVLKALMHLDEWSKPEEPTKPVVNALDKIRIYNDPYGVVLIMSAWNFPINLVFAPLVGAISAGNCVIIKPSEVAQASAQLIADLVPQYLDKECYPVYLGEVAETTELLQEKFDYIFFTGSTAVGRIIHAAANKNLTPVTLELGGKSPVYIDKSANMEMSVRRILWGKCANAGQVCIAPDYILCTKEIQANFILTAKKVLKEWYGNDIKASSDFCRLISDRHYSRLVNFLKDKRNIAIGGQMDSNQRFIEPTILTDVSPNDPIMQDEIFGPILPIVTVGNPYEAVSFINAREKPLAIYVFTKEKKIKQLFLNNTSSGGVLINDTVLHFAVESLPFGGVGFSGMGAYHGKASFNTFVHKKSVLERDFSTVSEKGSSLRYPPYSETKTALLNTILRPRRGIPWRSLKTFFIFCLGVVVIIVIQVIYHAVTDRHLL